jgi:hypothetical protein
MARPTKTGLDYFPMDCHVDDEVNLIIADYGIEGFGVLVAMFQSIYSKGYFMEWSYRQQKLFSRKIGLEFEKTVAVINECLEWGIFNKELFEAYEILTSERIQEHYVTSTYKRAGVTMLQEYLLVKTDNRKHITVEVSDDGNSDTTEVSDDESTQSKVKESKEKDINNNIGDSENESADANSETTDPVVEEDVEDHNDFFEKCWALFPSKKGKGSIKDSHKKKIFKLGDEFIRCINRYKEYVEYERNNGFPHMSYMHGSRFFKTDYTDYLDKVYKPPSRAAPADLKGKNGFNNFGGYNDPANIELEQIIVLRKGVSNGK